MSKKILLADDDPDLRFITQMALMEAGYEVETAANGQEAVQHAGKTTYDLILMDALMPVMDGYEACLQIKNNPATSSVPVVFLTAKVPDRAVQEKVGDVRYISKPYTPDGLVKRLAQIFEEKK